MKAKDIPNAVAGAAEPIPPVVAEKRTISFFSKAQLDLLSKAETVVAAARQTDNVAPLQSRGIEPLWVDDLNSDVAACRDLINAATSGRGDRKAATAQENAARKTLMDGLKQVQAAARQKFGASDPNALAAYYIGQQLSNASRASLEQMTTGILARIATDNLPGIGAAQVTAIQAAQTAWDNAHNAQGESQSGSQTSRAQAVALLQDGPNSIDARRRTIQFAADAQWPTSNPVNAGVRRQFLLQPNRPFTG